MNLGSFKPWNLRLNWKLDGTDWFSAKRTQQPATGGPLLAAVCARTLSIAAGTTPSSIILSQRSHSLIHYLHRFTHRPFNPSPTPLPRPRGRLLLYPLNSSCTIPTCWPLKCHGIHDPKSVFAGSLNATKLKSGCWNSGGSHYSRQQWNGARFLGYWLEVWEAVATQKMPRHQTLCGYNPFTYSGTVNQEAGKGIKQFSCLFGKCKVSQQGRSVEQRARDIVSESLVFRETKPRGKSLFK